MFAVQGNANPLNSTEYAALDARIGDLSDLTTTDKSSVVGAVNALNSKLANKTDLIYQNTLANGDSDTVILPGNNNTYFLFASRSNEFGVFLINVSSSAGITVHAIHQSERLAITVASSSSITIASTAGGYHVEIIG